MVDVCGNNAARSQECGSKSEQQGTPCVHSPQTAAMCKTSGKHTTQAEWVTSNTNPPTQTVRSLMNPRTVLSRETVTHPKLARQYPLASHAWNTQWMWTPASLRAGLPVAAQRSHQRPQHPQPLTRKSPADKPPPGELTHCHTDSHTANTTHHSC